MDRPSIVDLHLVRCRCWQHRVGLPAPNAMHVVRWYFKTCMHRDRCVLVSTTPRTCVICLGWRWYCLLTRHAAPACWAFALIFRDPFTVDMFTFPIIRGVHRVSKAPMGCRHIPFYFFSTFLDQACPGIDCSRLFPSFPPCCHTIGIADEGCLRSEPVLQHSHVIHACHATLLDRRWTHIALDP